MTSHIEAQLAQHRQNPALVESKTPKQGKTSPAPKAPATAKELAARAQAVGFSRTAWENDTFGVTLFCRKYAVQTKEQAAALDQEYYRVTNTQP